MSYVEALKKVFQFKQIPPVIAIVMFFTYPLYWILKLILWLLGFWRCKTCNRLLWVYSAKNPHHQKLYVSDGYYVVTTNHCDSCMVGNELTGDN